MSEGVTPRDCTCHPDDMPPVPCPHKYAYSECMRAHVDALKQQLAEAQARCQDLHDNGERLLNAADSWKAEAERLRGINNALERAEAELVRYRDRCAELEAKVESMKMENWPVAKDKPLPDFDSLVAKRGEAE